MGVREYVSVLFCLMCNLVQFPNIRSHFVCVVGPPVIDYVNEEIVSLEGRKVLLTCAVTNDADAVGALTIVWYNSVGDEVKPERGHILVYNRTISNTGQVESVLLFDPVHHTDHGDYTCRASNNPHTFVESKTSLTVECTKVPKVFCILIY